MNVTALLDDLRAYGVQLEPEGLKLPMPRWPKNFPPTLRQAFQQNRRAIMGRVAPPVFIDLKSRSLCTDATSGKTYAQHPSTEIVSLLALIDEVLIVWFPGLGVEFAEALVKRLGHSSVPICQEAIVFGTGPTVPPLMRQAAKSGRAFCSHDSHNRDACVWVAKKLPQPSRWIDTRFFARAGGWPDNFSELGRSVTGSGHCGAAPELVQVFCEPDKQGRFREALFDEWTAFLQGNVDHLLHMADIHDHIAQHDEPELLEVDAAINHRGIELDVPLAATILRLAREQMLSNFDDIALATNGAVTASDLYDVNHVLSWLRSWGLQFRNLHTETIEWLLNDARSAGVPFHPAVAAVLEARLTIARQPTGNLERALDLVDADGRIRNHLTYFATRAGKWRGRHIRFEELWTSTPVNAVDGSAFVNIQNVDANQANLPEGVVTEESIASWIDLCFRPASEHLFAIGKYLTFESRSLAWCAENENRHRGEPGVDLLPDSRRAVENAVQAAIDTGDESFVSRCRLTFEDGNLCVRLPSGRVMYYRDFRQMARRCSLLCPQRDTSVKEQTVPPVRLSIFDQIADDIVQAICRDLLAAALIRCEREQLPVVLHFQDQIIVEVPEAVAPVALERLLAIMSTLPAWAHDFPIEVEGFIDARFQGSSPPGGVLIKAQDRE